MTGKISELMSNPGAPNPCIKAVTTTKVIEGYIVGLDNYPRCKVIPAALGVEAVSLTIDRHLYNKSDLKHLIQSLTEIHEVL